MHGRVPSMQGKNHGFRSGSDGTTLLAHGPPLLSFPLGIRWDHSACPRGPSLILFFKKISATSLAQSGDSCPPGAPRSFVTRIWSLTDFLLRPPPPPFSSSLTPTRPHTRGVPVSLRVSIRRVLGYFACSCGDTFASEFGELSAETPVLITTLQPAVPGRDGTSFDFSIILNPLFSSLPPTLACASCPFFGGVAFGLID